MITRETAVTRIKQIMKQGSTAFHPRITRMRNLNQYDQEDINLSNLNLANLVGRMKMFQFKNCNAGLIFYCFQNQG